MDHRTKPSPYAVQANIPLASAFAASGVFLLFACLASEPTQVVLLGMVVCFFVVLGFAEIQEHKKERRVWDRALTMLPLPFALATEPGFFKEHVKIAESMTKIVGHSDLLFQDLCRSRIEAVAEEMTTMAKGEVVFDATETWRTAYQRVLETMRVKTYYSVAWVRTNEYWNDAPGRQSMRLNYELVGRGIRIERVHILPDDLWAFDEKMPTGGILEWLVEQQGRGIVVSLVRESDLANEPDLLRDFAIYGERAMGIQELDEQSHTSRFILSFDQPSIRHALGQWERLSLFSISFQNLLDR